MTFTAYWKKNKFKIIVTCSIVFILLMYIVNTGWRRTGTWTLAYSYNPDTKKTYYTRESKGEIECRRVLEKFFLRPFPNRRPEFMINNVTGKPLELDCYNEELGLACEYNGKQHYEYVAGMHKNHEDFRLQQYRDEMKKKLCKENGVDLIVVSYHTPIESIENTIRGQLQSLGYRI